MRLFFTYLCLQFTLLINIIYHFLILQKSCLHYILYIMQFKKKTVTYHFKGNQWHIYIDYITSFNFDSLYKNHRKSNLKEALFNRISKKPSVTFYKEWVLFIPHHSSEHWKSYIYKRGVGSEIVALYKDLYNHVWTISQNFKRWIYLQYVLLPVTLRNHGENQESMSTDKSHLPANYLQGECLVILGGISVKSEK